MPAARRDRSLIGQLHRSWDWMLALGIVFVFFGSITLLGDATIRFASVLVFGWLLLISGMIALIDAFTSGGSPGSLLLLLSALLRGFTGYLLASYPEITPFSVTLILALFFVVGGLFRAIGAGMLQFPRWIWCALSGVVSVALGTSLIARLPLPSITFVGVAIGIDLLFEGASLISTAKAIHRLSGRSSGHIA